MKSNVRVNSWSRESDSALSTAVVVHPEFHPEGLWVRRVRFHRSGHLPLQDHVGYIVTCAAGGGILRVSGGTENILRLRAGVHVYVPPQAGADFESSGPSELVVAAAPNAAQARGHLLIVRDELFMAGCATATQALRWILTPQYLSRRIFLHHDETLLSRRGDPISWFHTTMFDVIGLPVNEEGEPVFKMSYNSRTELNSCYDVKGNARVRFALRPYSDQRQPWSPWATVSNETTYHLNEVADVDAEESRVGEVKEIRPIRNKHEIFISPGGHVSLYCMFDPAPTGIERHNPGEYSDYEPLARVIQRPEYITHGRDIVVHDRLLNELSFARATTGLEETRKLPTYARYCLGRDRQAALERRLCAALEHEGAGRELVIKAWTQPGPAHDGGSSEPQGT